MFVDIHIIDMDATALIVESFHASKWKLLCLDFDATLISIHTNGNWNEESVADLVQYVRPLFKQLIPAILQRKTIAIAVVTFSSQLHLIQRVLEACFGQEIAGLSISNVYVCIYIIFPVLIICV